MNTMRTKGPLFPQEIIGQPIKIEISRAGRTHHYTGTLIGSTGDQVIIRDRIGNHYGIPFIGKDKHGRPMAIRQITTTQQGSEFIIYDNRHNIPETYDERDQDNVEELRRRSFGILSLSKARSFSLDSAPLIEVVRRETPKKKERNRGKGPPDLKNYFPTISEWDFASPSLR